MSMYSIGRDLISNEQILNRNVRRTRRRGSRYYSYLSVVCLIGVLLGAAFRHLLEPQLSQLSIYEPNRTSDVFRTWLATRNISLAYGRPSSRYTDTCKRNMKTAGIKTNT
ncbi:hypothetical protein LSAT2_013721 [Lamellibrachia satsuma]|nr:hypothetical protein LSAT2_013721 [Lamellibrachia satsuma]